MKTYIDKTVAVKAAQYGANEWDGGNNQSRDIYIEKAVGEVPVADVVEVVHAKWVVYEDLFGEIGHCSACGFFMGVNEPGNGLPDVENLKYCPNCGAKME